MHSGRAQAALEYLMTYGWALVIIVTVVGVLFVVINEFNRDQTNGSV